MREDNMLRFIYNHFKQQFWDLLIEDFYSFIPVELKEPSIEFLVQGKEKLQKSWQIQAYNIQRRSIMDNNNADVYKGMLIILRAQLLILEKGSRKTYPPVVPGTKEEDPISGVEDFITRGKERFGEKVV